MTSTLRLLLALGVALGAAGAQARPSARLLLDAPRVLLAATDAALTAPAAAPAPGISYGAHLVKTTAAGVVASSAGVLLGAALGSLSNHLLGAALPVLLANLFLPPVVTAVTALVLGNWNTPGRFGLWLPLGGAFVVNAALYVVASLFLVVPWTNPLALLAYTVVDGLLMAGATVGLMHALETNPAPAPTPTITSFVPGVSDTALVPMARVAL